MVQLRVVTRDGEKDLEAPELSPEATDSEIISAAERRLETDLNGYMVTREKDRVLVNPSPVYG